tara:strand:+ start:636 stop:947 length:312 start_codon:yes stop_codon:yes gene_type:complete
VLNSESGEMEKLKVVKTISSIYEHNMEDDHVWDCYCAFLDLFLEDDAITTNYLINLIELTRGQRLVYRNKLAEMGFELTPNELNQYIFLLLMALNEYMDSIDA